MFSDVMEVWSIRHGKVFLFCLKNRLKHHQMKCRLISASGVNSSRRIHFNTEALTIASENQNF